MWFPIILTLLTGYMLGNLNGSVSISNLVEKDDVRNHGSGNAGLTNFFRNFGGWNTLLVFAVDFLKAVLACYAGGLLLKPYGFYQEGQMLGAIAVTLGHDFPILLGLKGGKGILCGFTIALVIDWRIALIILGVFVLLTPQPSLCLWVPLAALPCLSWVSQFSTTITSGCCWVVSPWVFWLFICTGRISSAS